LGHKRGSPCSEGDDPTAAPRVGQRQPARGQSRQRTKKKPSATSRPSVACAVARRAIEDVTVRALRPGRSSSRARRANLEAHVALTGFRAELSGPRPILRNVVNERVGAGSAPSRRVGPRPLRSRGSGRAGAPGEPHFPSNHRLASTRRIAQPPSSKRRRHRARAPAVRRAGAKPASLSTAFRSLGSGRSRVGAMQVAIGRGSRVTAVEPTRR